VLDQILVEVTHKADAPAWMQNSVAVFVGLFAVYVVLYAVRTFYNKK
jgi:pyrrolidone-carboxylate peptidase